MMTRILGIIPARGGSKGISRKNLHPLAGQPLLYYTFQAVRDSNLLTRTILSTEDQEIAEYAIRQGIDVPFRRPPELAQDDTPSLAVIQHALQRLAEEYVPDVVVLLQPTAPLRQGRHIDEAIRLLVEQEAEAVVSVTRIPAHYHPYWAFTLDDAQVMRPFDERGGPWRYPRRQLLPSVYYRNGAVYAARRQLIWEQHTLYGSTPLAYIMPPEVSVNIDSPEDLRAAEHIILSKGR